jgi:Protein of unknown function (DUF2786)
MSAEIRDKYVDKINKLLARAEGTDSEAERDTSLMMAQNLMTKWAIDEAMLMAARGNETTVDPIISEEFVIVGIYRFPLKQLAHVTLINNGIKDIQLHDPGWREVNGKVYKETEVLVAVGTKSDMERAKMLYTSLHIQILTAESQWWRDNEQLYSDQKPSQKHQARRGFMFAFADGVSVKLREATRRGRQLAEEEHDKNKMALVLQSKEMRVQDEFRKKFPHTISVKDRKNKGDAWARKHGFEAGQKADVGQGRIGGQSGRRKELT